MSFNPNEWPTFKSVAVAWGDMDAFKHVNNTRYFRYFEDARIHYFHALKELDLSQTKEIGPVLKSTQCEFIRPITFPDELLCYVRTTSMGTSSMVMQHAIWSQKQQSIVAKGEAVIVLINSNTGTKEAIPAKLRQAISDIEGRVF